MTFEEAGETGWDALVLGAGPAGSIAARELARAGARTLLVEKSSFPRRKVCGACLNGHALHSLRAVGLGDRIGLAGGSSPHPTLPHEGGGFSWLSEEIQIPPPSWGRVGWGGGATKPAAVGMESFLRPVPLHAFELRSSGRSATVPLPEGVALSRSCLDTALADAASEAGTSVLFETRARIEGIAADAREVRLIRHGKALRVRARVVLDAAGLGGASPSKSNAEAAPGSRIGAGCVVDQAPDDYRPGTIFMAAGRRGYVGLVRVEDGSLNVAAAFDPEFVRSLGSPGLAAAAIVEEAGFPPIPGLEWAGWRGTPALTRRARVLGEARLFLVGDAAGYVEPFTGEGMAWAIASGRAVAPMALRAIESWDDRLVREWTATHRRIVGRRQIACRAASVALRRPWLIPAVCGGLARWPGASRFVVRRLNAPSPLPTS